MVSGRGNTLIVHVDGDVAAFRRQMQAAGHDVEQFERSATKAGSSSGVSFGTLAGSIGVATLAAGALSSTAAVLRAEFGRVITAASDMAETQSKVGVVFGESAGAIRAWGEDAASNLGLSTQKALEGAATFANFAQALGVSREQASTMSPALIQLAADLASFNNANPEETLLALRSGLAGEAEPMRRLGVAINATTVEAKALELGLEKVGGQFTEGAKVQARYALIMEQTKSAQGDFARTADGLANGQRTLTANFENLRAKLGEGVTPALADATRELNDFLESAEGEQAVDDLAAAMGSLARAATGAASAIGRVIGAVRDLNNLPRGSTGLSTFEFFDLPGALNDPSRARDLARALKGLPPETPSVPRNAGLTEAEVNGPGGLGPIRSRSEIFGPPGSIFPLPDTALDKLTPEELEKRMRDVASAAQHLAMDALPDLSNSAKGASGGISELRDRADEAFELSAVRNLQLAHKMMEEAELAAVKTIEERTRAEQALLEQQRAYIGILNGLGARGVSFAPGVFDSIARAGGLTPIGEFTNITGPDGQPIPRTPEPSTVTVTLGGDLSLEGVP